ncbi:MAG TPA: hypothetical protein VM290_09845 [Gaiellaceae bacterium]|nr:hypothetical protein [Gaiellaceae bacterium]
MTRGDDTVERAADKLEEASQSAAARGGVAAKAADELAADAAFLRKLKPSLIAARIRGDAPTDAKPGATPAAPSAPQLTRGNGGGAKPNGGRNPIVVVAAALAVGVLLAKVIDWRGHAHPKL